MQLVLNKRETLKAKVQWISLFSTIHITIYSTGRIGVLYMMYMSAVYWQRGGTKNANSET